SWRYRHVVFDPGRQQRVVNFAPAQPIVSAATPIRYLTSRSTKLSEQEESFLIWLFGRADLDAPIYRAETLRRRLGACLRALRVDSVDAARQLLDRDPARIPFAIGTLVIGVTSFFRDAAVFDHLTYTVLPALPKPPQQRRIWCAGCSDGDELY